VFVWKSAFRTTSTCTFGWIDKQKFLGFGCVGDHVALAPFQWAKGLVCDCDLMGDKWKVEQGSCCCGPAQTIGTERSRSCAFLGDIEWPCISADQDANE
jgi:hypothetical protein